MLIQKECCLLNGTYHDLLAKLGAGSAHPGGFEISMDLVSELNMDENTKVLDIGCGTGRTACYISKKYGCQVTGLDRHPLMIEKANRRSQRNNCTAGFIQGDALSMPFQDNDFDVVLAESLAVFLPIKPLLSECRRILKPEGLMVNLEFCSHLDTPHEVLEAAADLYGVKQFPTCDEWRDYYRSCRFRDIQLWNPREADSQLFIENELKYRDEDQMISEGIVHDQKFVNKIIHNMEFMEQYDKHLGFTGIIAKK